MMYIFYDCNKGHDIAFTSEKKAKDFIRKIKHWVNENDKNNWVEYSLEEIPVNTSAEDWIKEYGYDLLN